MRLPSTLRKVLFTLVTVGVLLGSAEGLLRLLGPPPQPALPDLSMRGGASTVADPLFGWRLRPGADLGNDPVRWAWESRWGLPHGPPDPPVNSIGMRDDEVELPKPDDELRYLCMGDSSVMGTGVPWTATFAQRLEARLNQEGTPPRVQVLNGGVSAWTSYQSILQLRALLPYGLDGAIVYNQLSDMMPVEQGVPDFIYFPVVERLQLARGLTRLFVYRWLQHLLRRDGPPPVPDRLTLRVPLRHYRDNLRRITRLARSHDLDLVFVIPPVQSDLAQAPEQDYLPDDPAEAEAIEALLAEVEDGDSASQTRTHYRAAMALEAFRAGVPVVDGPRLFRDAWQAHPDRYTGPNALFVDRIHPSITGHALLAEAILPHLQAMVARRKAR